MSLRAEAFVEPTCPYSYMLFHAVEALRGEGELEPTWRVVTLSADRGRSGTRAALADSAMREAGHRATWPAVQALAYRDYGLSLAQPGCTTDPRPACVAAAYVRSVARDRLPAFIGLLFEAHFSRDVDEAPEAPGIDDPATLARLIHASGATAAGLSEALTPGRRSKLLAEDRRAADAEGLAAVPTLRLGEHVLLGAQPPAVLRGALAGQRARASLPEVTRRLMPSAGSPSLDAEESTDG